MAGVCYPEQEDKRMSRVLDELATAFHTAQGSHLPWRVVGSLELGQQLRQPITPAQWTKLQRRIPCPLPPLERDVSGQWSFPCGWVTVVDLATHVAHLWPSWHLPTKVSVEDWRNAQVFAGVRSCLVECLNVDPEQVVREA